MSLKYKNAFKSNEDKNFLFEIDEKLCIYVGESLVSFKTGGRTVDFVFSRRI